MTYGLQFVVLLAAVVVIANVLARRRQAARRTTTTDFARQRGLAPAGDENPLLGAYAPLPPPPGIGVSVVRPHVLEAIASGRGTVRNVLRGGTAAGEVLVLDYRMPPEGGEKRPKLFATWAAFRVLAVPTFQLFPRPRFAIGLKVVKLDGAPGFSSRFVLRAADEGEMRRSFTPTVVAACEALPARKEWQISAGGGWVLVTFGLAERGDLGVLLEASERVAAALQAPSRA
jgi:hypothetical protein